MTNRKQLEDSIVDALHNLTIGEEITLQEEINLFRGVVVKAELGSVDEYVNIINGGSDIVTTLDVERLPRGQIIFSLFIHANTRENLNLFFDEMIPILIGIKEVTRVQSGPEARGPNNIYITQINVIFG